MDKNLDRVLRSLYYDVSLPSGFGGVQKLYLAGRKIMPTVTKKDVKTWLSGEFAYTLHKPVRRKFKRNPIFVIDVDEQWEADLVDMQEFKEENQNFNYLLTCIDCFSKYAFVEPLKNKTNSAVVQAFRNIVKNSRRQPFRLRTDKGKEFINNEMRQFCHSNNIIHFTSNDQPFKCAIVERFNRTLKEKMFKFFTSKGHSRWVNVLPDLVDAYNKAKHSSIGMAPSEALLPTKRGIVFKKLYGVSGVKEYFANQFQKSRLKTGDIV